MIYFVDERRFADLKSFCTIQSIYSCRIMCLADSYGLKFDFVQFWLQYNESGKVISAISKYDNAVTVQKTENSNISELTEFLGIIGFTSILSDICFFDNEKATDGIIMELVNPKRKNISNTEIIVNPDLNEIYKLLTECQSEKFVVPKYEDFLLDMSHKIRHNTALCVAVRNKGDLVSTAMTVAQSDNTAIIGAVATVPKFRKYRFGGLAVLSLAEMLKNRKIFIMRDKDENGDFYKSLGFEDKGKFIISKS